jgi:hypothetical protein
MEDPEHRALAIMELRAYQRTKAAIDAAKNTKDEPQTPMAEWVWQVRVEQMRQKKARRREGKGQSG